MGRHRKSPGAHLPWPSVWPTVSHLDKSVDALPDRYKDRVCGVLYRHKFVTVIWTGKVLMCRHQRPRRTLANCAQCRAKTERIRELLRQVRGDKNEATNAVDGAQASCK